MRRHGACGNERASEQMGQGRKPSKKWRGGWCPWSGWRRGDVHGVLRSPEARHRPAQVSSRRRRRRPSSSSPTLHPPPSTAVHPRCCYLAHHPTSHHQPTCGRGSRGFFFLQHCHCHQQKRIKNCTGERNEPSRIFQCPDTLIS